jgi:hypothetical protein
MNRPKQREQVRVGQRFPLGRAAALVVMFKKTYYGNG